MIYIITRSGISLETEFFFLFQDRFETQNGYVFSFSFDNFFILVPNTQ